MPDLKTVGEFEVDKDDDAILGNGSMGTVYMATNTTTKQPAAAKEIYIGNDKRKAEQAQSEVEIMKALSNHPNIVTMLGSIIKGKHLWIFMDYCNLGNLDDYCIKTDISSRQRVSMMIDMCLAIEHLHSQARPIAHRDVKPENVLLKWDSLQRKATVMFSDFGVSKMATTFSTFAGTKEFMAPELFAVLDHIDDEDILKTYGVSVDIFSLGLLIHSFFDAIKKKIIPLMGMVYNSYV